MIGYLALFMVSIVGTSITGANATTGYFPLTGDLSPTVQVANGVVAGLFFILAVFALTKAVSGS